MRVNAVNLKTVEYQNHNMDKRLFLALLILVIPGCETTPSKPDAVNESEVNISYPEGMIAFLAYVDGFWQVFTTNFENQKQITRSTYDKSRISWFPDGKHLLVNANEGRLYKVNIETGLETEIEIDLVGMTDAVLSPNGEHIVFSLSTAESVDANNLWLMNSDGTDLKKITNMQWLQHEPAWDSRGEWIYFLSGKGGQTHDIWRVSTKTRQTEQLTVGSLYHFDVAIAADDTMAYSSNRSGDYEIWIQKMNDKAHMLTENDFLDARPNWSPDGKWIIYESASEGIINIWIMDKDGQFPKQLTQNEVGARFPVWKPVTKSNH